MQSFVRCCLWSSFLLLVAHLMFYGGRVPSLRAYAAAGDGSPTDTNIKYIGRWDSSSSSMVRSYWGGAYFKVGFTGTTIGIKLVAPVTIWASIDGVDTFYRDVSGTVNLTPTPLAEKSHLLRVAAQSTADSIQFQGLVLATGASTFAPPFASKSIEFVGDSITAGAVNTKGALSDYAWIIGERLSMEHIQIAQPGICLIDSVQCYSPYAIGMSQQFFKLQTVDSPQQSNWDFSRYQPAAVVVNIGTNEHWSGNPDGLFEKTYIDFLQKLRAKYPNALIFVLRTFGGYKEDATMNAIRTTIMGEDKNIRYLDTTDWLNPGDFVSDGFHPSDAGQIKIANLLEPLLADALDIFPADPTASYKVVNRLSGLALSLTAKGSDSQIVQRRYIGTDDQRWHLLPVGDGSYKLMNVSSGLLLQGVQATSASGSDSTRLKQGPDDGGMNSWFEVKGSANGYYNLVNEQNSLYVDDANVLHVSGDSISEQISDGKRDQQWSISPTMP